SLVKCRVHHNASKNDQPKTTWLRHILVSKRRRGKPTADPLDRRLANVQTRIRHRYQELLTAVTEHLVIGANIRLDVLHRGLKHLVAYEMAVGVIDDLEVVQVHNSNKALLNMPFNHLK